MKTFISVVAIVLFFNLTILAQPLYFPPVTGSNWDTMNISNLGWCQPKIDSLYNYLETKNTKGFVVLKDGKIVLEKYFQTFTVDSLWYWASAAKSLTSFLVGMAQEQGLIDITQPTSTYLGAGFTNCTSAQESLITVLDQLRMTTGLDDMVPDPDCFDPLCLNYLTTPGNRWAYHNAPYTLLHDVIANASGSSINQFTYSQLSQMIGMQGLWALTGNTRTYYSNVRGMARFGLLMLANGIWNADTLLADQIYFNNSINTSQNLNESYGYLWWLNGKSSFMVPGIQFTFQGSLIPNAPADMYAALGKNDQKIYVVPSQRMVVVRMGNAADSINPALSDFDDELWLKLSLLGCNTSLDQSNNDTPSLHYIIQNNELHIWMDGNSTFWKEALLLNSLGQVVAKTFSNNENAVTIKIENLAKGIYEFIGTDARRQRVQLKIAVY
ncbi:MAG: hypothetical protein RIQ89_2301 [Bacteroidota bacterium]